MRAAHYTEVDAAQDYIVFQPPVIDIAPVLDGEAATQAVVEQVQAECEATGFLALSGHGIAEEQLQGLFESSRALFDQPLAAKSALVVGNMTKGRGYEISPEHKQYMDAFKEKWSCGSSAAPCSGSGEGDVAGPSSGPSRCPPQEPSALDGILSERFLCGPPLTEPERADPYFSEGLGPVFFAPDSWPDEAAAPGLRSRMQECYQSMAMVADAALALMAAALGLEAGYFDAMTRRHCSNMQVANYPSQLIDPSSLGLDHIRKKAHTDSGILTLLASEDWLPGSGWRPGDGGLQLLDASGRWVEVAVPEGALLLNLGSTLTRLTNGRWKSTLHRVTNPTRRQNANEQQQQQQQQHDLLLHPRSTRRLSVAFFHKPDYSALVDVVPTCLEQDSAGRSGGRRFEPALASNLTRQGVLHKYSHLPPEEASRRYHEEMAKTRRMT